MKLVLQSVFVVFFSFFSALQAQNTITDAYEAHFENPRELVHVHLNKTVFYKGEMVGFKAYVFDKNSKQLSKSTRNLYCVISDMDNNAIKSAMLLVEDGVTSSAMDIDSSFTPGKYIFKAYTNWMRNFDEPNHFSSIIEVNDFDDSVNTSNRSTVVKPDIQVLPEGGHLLADVPNNLGIIAKDQNGNGLKDAIAYLLNAKNDTLNSVPLDRFGIGKTLIIPENGNSYKILVKYGYTVYETKVPPAKPIGIAMRVSKKDDKAIVSLSTNSQSIPILGNKTFFMTIHNGGQMGLQQFKFNGKPNVNILLNKEQLYPGINVLTIFDQDKRPILERLLFNHQDIKQVVAAKPKVSRLKDSIRVSVPLVGRDGNGFESISVSVLPAATKAYNPDGNLISNLYLKPYIKGNIENVAYYFDRPGSRKAYQLDNLLLTQGWSSYDWKNIFSTPGMPIHRFERGIDFNVNINNKRANSYIIEGMEQSKPILFDLPSEENSFEGKGLYPKSNERFMLSAVSENGSVFKPGAVVNFTPNTIPHLEIKPTLFNQNLDSGTLLYDNAGLTPIVNEEVTVLDEVTLKAQLTEQRFDKLQKQYSGFGDVKLVDDIDLASNMTFAQWITKFGYTTTENINGNPRFSITQNRNRWPVLIFFDGVPLRGGIIDFLYNFMIHNIDYVVLDKSGFSAPFGGQVGIIRIKTRNNIGLSGSVFAGRLVKDFELTFTSDKSYYTPKYLNHNNDFFENFGVLGWEHNASVSNGGNLELTFTDKYKGDVRLFIEGIVDGQKFIAEEKTVEIN